MNKYTRVCARIDLDAIEYNMEMMKKNIKDSTKIMAVLKADGYGHGAVPIAKLLEEKEYIWGFAVATLDEAMALRKKEITKPILVLGTVFPDQWGAMIEHEIRMTLYREEVTKTVSDLACRMDKDVYIHVKIDTGMSRIGLQVNDSSVENILRMSQMPRIKMEGLFTHFAKADETDKTFTEQQLSRYLWIKDQLEEKGVTFPYYHCSNSAGIIDVPEANLDLVRSGISTYGLYPSEEVHKENVPLKPALTLISHVAHVKWVEAGTPVSYGGTYVTDRPTRLATIPIGYGDGYPRSLSNKGYVLIRGQKAPIRGRVCMDQMMVDVTDIEGADYGDQVVLIGRDGEESLPVETLSELSGRFNYEFVCDLGKRIPREFIRHGKVTEQIDWF